MRNYPKLRITHQKKAACGRLSVCSDFLKPRGFFAVYNSERSFINDRKGENSMEDREIIALFESRSENAISETANRYGGYLMTIASNILSDKRDAEETLSDAYMKAWNTIPPAKPAPLKRYLAVIVRSLALNKYQYNNAKKRNSEFEALLSELEICVPSNISVEKSLE